MVIAEYNWIVMAGRGFSFHPAGVAAQPTEQIESGTNGLIFLLQSGDAFWFIPLFCVHLIVRRGFETCVFQSYYVTRLSWLLDPHRCGKLLNNRITSQQDR